MVTWFYFIIFVLSLIMLIRVLVTNKKVDTLILVGISLLVINCLGRYMLASSKTLEVAILANKAIYVGACYLPIIMLLFLGKLCNIRIHKIWIALLTLGSSIVMGGALTIGKMEIYYKNAELAFGDGYSYLIKTYGPLHKLHIVMTFIYMAIMISFVIYAIRHRKEISTRTVVTISGIGLVVFFTYLIERISGSSISFLAIGYLIGIAFLTKYFERINMYDMSANISNSLERMSRYGYLAFDNKYRYISANTFIKELFPEIETWIVDEEVPVSDSYFYKVVVEYLKEWNGQENINKIININKDYYKLSIRRITYGTKGKNGYLLEFNDCTMEKKYSDAVENYGEAMERDVTEKTRALQDEQKKTKNLYLQTVTALSEAVDAKDRYTSGHSKRVAEYSRRIAERLGKSTEEQEEIYRAGLLHDIGKIRIPVEIINKTGKLTDEEYDIIRIHPITGYHILRGIAGDNVIATGAKYHHERYDGNGYPNGLAGNEIPEVARILGVADSYDAMTSNRSYRDGLQREIVRGEIEKGKGTQFDPKVADIMLQMIDEDKEYNMRQNDTMRRKILVVDDEMINRAIITRIMKDEPRYEIVSSESGSEALVLLDQQKFDLIMLDYMMPEMDGLETLRRIREKFTTPVVLMTSDKTLDTSKEFAKLGCDDYVTKPFLPMILKEIIHNMTERTEI